MEETKFTYQVDQNRTRDIFRRSGLVEISKGRVDQVPQTCNKRLHSIKCNVLIISHNCIRSWNPIVIGYLNSWVGDYLEKDRRAFGEGHESPIKLGGPNSLYEIL